MKIEKINVHFYDFGILDQKNNVVKRIKNCSELIFFANKYLTSIKIEFLYLISNKKQSIRLNCINLENNKIGDQNEHLYLLSY